MQGARGPQCSEDREAIRRISTCRVVEDRNMEQDIWEIYEVRKTELRDAGMTQEAYEHAVRELADELGV